MTKQNNNKNKKKILKIILDNREVKSQVLADILKRLFTVLTVLYKDLSMRKLFSKRTPRLLTVGQKPVS